LIRSTLVELVIFKSHCGLPFWFLYWSKMCDFALFTQSTISYSSISSLLCR